MLYAIVAVIALIIDQAVKYWTTVNIVVDTGEARLIPGFIHLANVHNTGAAFSFLEGARWFFVILCIIFCLVVVYVLVKNIITHPVARWAAVFVMAGAIGNCIDRIVCGYVVDMFEFDFLIFGKPFPVFNVADIFITVGVIVFCVSLLLDKPKAEKRNVPLAEAVAAEEAGQQKRQPQQHQHQQQRKPVISRRQRTPIPDFPKREHVKPDTAVNPDDPFAEWEKKGSTVYTQPDKNYSPEAVEFVNHLAEEAPAAQPAPAAPAGFEAAPAPAPKRVEAPPAPAAPAAPADAPAAPTVSYPAPAAKEQTEADAYNLDDILAEFKDL